jgi:hypothetical protein
MKFLIDFGTNPYYPMFLGFLLYVWCAIAWVYKGSPYFGAMWLMYGVANICLMLHAYTGK